MPGAPTSPISTDPSRRHTRDTGSVSNAPSRPGPAKQIVMLPHDVTQTRNTINIILTPCLRLSFLCCYIPRTKETSMFPVPNDPVYFIVASVSVCMAEGKRRKQAKEVNLS
jgi:hypothetical protein